MQDCLQRLTQRAFLVAMLLCALGFAYAAVGKEFSALDKLYQTGKLNELSEAITTLKPSSDEERACLAHYNALLKISTSEAIKAHVWLIEKFPSTPFAQASMLELGKIYILERRIEEAQTVLRKITSSAGMERFYWLALCDWWQDNYTTAITNAETYLRMNPKGSHTESAYYLIAESYLAQKKAYSAIATLTKLENLILTDLDEQYMLYRLGYAYEQSEKMVDAVASYRKGYELNKYSQIAYLIEDRLFELRSRNRNIDISFLYPYSLLQIAISPEDSTKAVSSPPIDKNNVIPTPQVTTVITPPNTDTPLKVKAKPKEGYWLQAGRFSVEANASKLVQNIRGMKLPSSYFEDVSGGKKSWVVLSGVFNDKPSAENAKRILAEKDISSFVTEY